MKRRLRPGLGLALGFALGCGLVLGGCGGDEEPERVQYPWEQEANGTGASDTGVDPTPESTDVGAEEAPAAAPDAFVTTSTVVFPGLTDQPHAWRCVYQGAERVRWELSLPGDASGRRQIEYRFADEGFLLPSGLKASVELGQLERARLFRSMALRRAAFRDGAGAAWTRRELPGGLGYIERSESSNAAGSESSTSERSEPEGASSSGRSYAVFDAEGSERERLEVGAWQTLDGIVWPRELALEADGNTIWSETVDEVRTRSWYAENYFRPPDRKLP